ncbi:MAG: crAss001_48 related protein [Eisenbergiella sp.]
MELKDTIKMMNSGDYKERFKAEYYQTLIRYNKLSEMVEKWDNGTLSFTPACSRDCFIDQLSFMSGYLDVLRERAFVEGVELEEI